ncbi:MAG: hypothetical protein ACLP0J_18920 [Solirubrobacteraceae bacterium]
MLEALAHAVRNAHRALRRNVNVQFLMLADAARAAIRSASP